MSDSASDDSEDVSVLVDRVIHDAHKQVTVEARNSRGRLSQGQDTPGGWTGRGHGRSVGERGERSKRGRERGGREEGERERETERGREERERGEREERKKDIERERKDRESESERMCECMRERETTRDRRNNERETNRQREVKQQPCSYMVRFRYQFPVHQVDFAFIPPTVERTQIVCEPVAMYTRCLICERP